MILRIEIKHEFIVHFPTFPDIHVKSPKCWLVEWNVRKCYHAHTMSTHMASIRYTIITEVNLGNMDVSQLELILNSLSVGECLLERKKENGGNEWHTQSKIESKLKRSKSYFGFGLFMYSECIHRHCSVSTRVRLCVHLLYISVNHKNNSSSHIAHLINKQISLFN
jgi:hypothetical protein